MMSDDIGTCIVCVLLPPAAAFQESNVKVDNYTGTFYLESNLYIHRNTTLDVSGRGYGGTSDELLLVRVGIGCAMFCVVRSHVVRMGHVVLHAVGQSWRGVWDSKTLVG